MNFFHAARFLEYLLFSGHKKGHGLHSPFIFDLVSRVFRNKMDRNVVCSIEKIRKQLIADKSIIIVNDLGSGLEKRKTNTRSVSEIARYSTIPEKYGVLLSGLAAEFGPRGIIELGTSFGISTMYMASSCRSAAVYTVEGCKACADIALNNFSETGLTNITLLNGSFDEVLPELIASGIRPGLIFIDGNHRKEPVLKYFRELASISDQETVIIIDDIYDSVEMSEAWEEIKQNKFVSVTVDIFRMGLVFLRKGISHSNYIIRY